LFLKGTAAALPLPERERAGVRGARRQKSGT
jgi:hypothetical protein